jgi:hypothetical protein
MLVVCFVPAPFTLPDLDPAIDPSFEEPEVHVLSGEWVNNTLVIVNTGNTKMEGKIRVQDPGGWRMRFDERIKFDEGLKNWSEPFEIDKDRSNNYTKRINLTMTPGPSLAMGNKTDVVVEVKFTDPNKNKGTRFARFLAVHGWVKPIEVPGEESIPLDEVKNYTISFKNVVNHPENGTTRFNLSLMVDGPLSYTLTGQDVTDMTPGEVNTTPPLDHVLLTNNGTADLRVWVYAAPDVNQTPGVQVALLVGRDGEPRSLTTIGFVLNVGTVVYEVSISTTDLQWSFVQGSTKNVTFNMVNRGNVQTQVTIEYDLTGAEAFDIDGPPSLTLAPGEVRVLPVEVRATGEVDDTATLKVEISYGNLQTSSASTLLEITVVPI